MSFTNAYELPAAEVPDLERLIIRRGDGPSAIRRHRHASHPIHVTFERTNERLRFPTALKALP